MGLTPKLEEVGKGTFDVLCQGVVIFSKAKEGRYPRDQELVKILRARNK